MNTSPSPDENQQELDELFQMYKKRHISLYRWGIAFWLTSFLARLLKKDPYQSLLGIALTALSSIMILVLPLLVITKITDSWDDPGMSMWIIICVIYGILIAVIGPLTVQADEDLLALHGSLSTTQGLHRLIAWDRRWFSYPVDFALTTFVTIICIVISITIHRLTGNYPLPVGVQVIGFYVFILLGLLSASLITLTCEIPLLTREQYQLFQYNPAQTLNLQRSLRGYNGLVRNDSLFITVIILLSAIMVPANSGLLVPITLILLGLAYSSIAIIMIMSRYLLGQIIRTGKEHELAILQERINVLWMHLLDLNENERNELERLEKNYERLANTPQSLLNLGQAINTFLLAVFFPTLSTIISFLLTNTLSSWFTTVIK